MGYGYNFTKTPKNAKAEDPQNAVGDEALVAEQPKAEKEKVRALLGKQHR
jgi:hypothetical protein